MTYDEEERRKLNELLSSGAITSEGMINGIPNQTLAALMADNSEPGVQFAQPQFQQGEMDRNREQFAREDVRAMERGYTPQQFKSPEQPASAPQAPEPQNFFQRSGGPKVSLDQFAPKGRQHDVFVDGPLELGRQRTPDGGEMIIKRVPTMDSFGRQSAQVVQEFVPPPDMGRMKQTAEIQKLQAETRKAERGEAPKVPEKAQLFQMYQSMPDSPVKEDFGRVIGVGGKESKGEKAMQGMSDVISQAESILTGKVAGQKALPTESPIGAGYDYVASLVGATPAGASEADQLKVLGGALTSKMPRMEGPQSEYDVKLYQEMAGRIGDPTVPRERRIAALKQVRDLWAKYDKSAQPAAVDTGKTIVRTVKLKNGRTGIEYSDGTRVTQ